MAWTTPMTWTNTLSDASDWNEQIRDNLLALKQPPTAHYEANEGADYANSGGYTDVDSTSLSFTFTTTGGDVLIGFAASGFCATGGGGYAIGGLIDVSVDGSRIANNASGGLRNVLDTGFNISFCRWVRGLAAGSHTFTLQFRVITAVTPFTIYAGAGTASFDLHPRFWVREIS